MIGNNSCGVHSMLGGKTDANVEVLDVLLYDGSRMRSAGLTSSELEQAIRWRWPAGGDSRPASRAARPLRRLKSAAASPTFPAACRATTSTICLPERGFDVAKSLVGSEGTCVMVLEATLRLVDSPPARSLVVLGYPSVYEAADHIPEIRAVQADRPGRNRRSIGGRHDPLAHSSRGYAAFARRRRLAVLRIRRRRRSKNRTPRPMR